MSKERITVNGTEYKMSVSKTQNEIQISECDGNSVAILDIDGADYGQEQEAEDKFERHVRKQDEIPIEDLYAIFISHAI
ncbi:hypothetical protein [Haloparvum sp. PAK95]|uniref:hypothetical protein n=1 Tax=Haloparvum sp. PAK95 TaxID=3418962 RepID=UPI003D2F1B68